MANLSDKQQDILTQSFNVCFQAMISNYDPIEWNTQINHKICNLDSNDLRFLFGTVAYMIQMSKENENSESDEINYFI